MAPDERPSSGGLGRGHSGLCCAVIDTLKADADRFLCKKDSVNIQGRCFLLTCQMRWPRSQYFIGGTYYF